MALFCINRYLGGDKPSNSLDDKSRSQILLQKLHQEAKARQRQLGVKADTTDEQQEENQESDRSEGVQDGKRKARAEAVISEESRKKKKRLSRGNKESGRKPKSKEDGDAELVTDTLCKEIIKISSAGTERKDKREYQSTKATDEITDDEARPLDVSGELIKSQEKGSEDLGKAEQQGVKEESDQNENQTPVASTFTILGGFKKKKIQKVQRVLPQWLSKPTLVNRDIRQNLTAIEDVAGIHPKLIQKLQTNGIHSFFPVQAEVIPALLESSKHGLILGRGGYRPSDICVSAPTGSGKTLAFVIPVIQALMDCTVCRVRALALLPTKELAQQVFKIFNTYVEGMDLRVVIVAGQKPFAMEQSSLVEHTVMGYRSLADIVISTPGRLVDHITKTDGFSLQHLRYLIIDEADRMIDSMHHNWLNQVVKAVYKVDEHSASDVLFQRVEPGVCTAVSHSRLQMPLQKLLFSATLTKDSEKLQQLALHHPRLFTANYTPQEQEPHVTLGEQQPPAGSAENKYTLPEGLTEFYVPCQLNKKPLIILYFVLRMKFSRILCFTNSRDASHRLFLLLRAFGGVHVAEFSSRLSPSERRKTLKQFEQGKLQILISTDATARGIDVSNVTCVINYDAPHFIRTYIHRVGRTARAGNTGLAFTLLLKVQEKQFLQMLSDAGSANLKKQLVKPEHLRPLIPRYEEALQELRQILKDEKKSLST
ncbi:ATP-dependent RNA helicase DDX51 isoform X1 [Pristis pectinata]|uniref:ATP-dependent RNA helicase DDX51 isoform X1 n=1 Tax=Pristis pectinata TaxID=685728 RepID=UPI00223E5255|nr:ATP-dependent RNA helicase DDX51 isoform X1 [Pristis pectinata]